MIIRAESTKLWKGAVRVRRCMRVDDERWARRLYSDARGHLGNQRKGIMGCRWMGPRSSKVRETPGGVWIGWQEGSRPNDRAHLSSLSLPRPSGPLFDPSVGLLSGPSISILISAFRTLNPAQQSTQHPPEPTDLTSASLPPPLPPLIFNLDRPPFSIPSASSSCSAAPRNGPSPRGRRPEL